MFFLTTRLYRLYDLYTLSMRLCNQNDWWTWYGMSLDLQQSCSPIGEVTFNQWDGVDALMVFKDTKTLDISKKLIFMHHVVSLHLL